MGRNPKTGSILQDASPWIVDLTPARRPRVTLLCIPYAGGGANLFRSWVPSLPSWIGLVAAQLPGREIRLGEPPLHDARPVIDALAVAAIPHLNRTPVAFFGHSMGATLAWELARALRDQGKGEPVHLFLSGRIAPHHPSLSPPMHDLPEPEFIRELERLGGTPGEVLASAELMELMLPTLRADFTLIETWDPKPGSPLSCPLTTFAGRKDGEAPPSTVKGWGSETTGPVVHHVLEGGHFFLNENPAALLKLIVPALSSL